MLIAYDDGAGNCKGKCGKTEVSFPSVVSSSPALTMSQDAWRDLQPNGAGHILVQESVNGNYELGRYCYAVGNDVLIQDPSASYDTSDERYTSHAARIRAYAMFGMLLGKTKEADVELVVGLNVQRFDTAGKKDELVQFFLGTHQFRVNDVAYTVRVHTVHVRPQPIAAQNYIMTNPPTHIAERLKKFPWDDPQTCSWLIDPGNFTLDVTVRRNNVPLRAGTFSRQIGVSTFWNNLSERLLQWRGSRPSLSEIGHALASRKMMNRQGEPENIATLIDEVRATTWSAMEQILRSGLRDYTPTFIFFVGWGTEVFRKEIETVFGVLPSGKPNTGFCIPPEPGMAIVRGYYGEFENKGPGRAG